MAGAIMDKVWGLIGMNQPESDNGEYRRCFKKI